jgi:hypothetical protein
MALCLAADQPPLLAQFPSLDELGNYLLCVAQFTDFPTSTHSNAATSIPFGKNTIHEAIKHALRRWQRGDTKAHTTQCRLRGCVSLYADFHVAVLAARQKRRACRPPRYTAVDRRHIQLVWSEHNGNERLFRPNKRGVRSMQLRPR